MRVGRDQIVGDRYALDNLDTLPSQRIVLHVAHRDETVDAGEAEPVNDIRHQLLETGILNPCDTFGALEVGSSCIAILLAFAGIVDKKLRHLAKRATFLPIINDDAETA